MCTSLLYFDQQEAPYAGRTLELPVEQPYLLVYQAQDSAHSSQVKNHPALHYTAQYSFLSIAVELDPNEDVKVVEGINSAGLTFSLLAFAASKGPEDTFSADTAVLSSVDLGGWLLSQFASVSEAKTALETQPILAVGLDFLGGIEPPFHYVLHDATGASIVIEYTHGKQNIYDNPIGVMTNGPEFPWHLTNLSNYTHFSNVDQLATTIRGVRFIQPDSGIASASLPSSNTSVGRFVRAAYYANFAEKAATAKDAIVTLAHIMNNFDRTRGITVDSTAHSSALDAGAPEVNGMPGYCSEYTSWTSLTDLRQGLFYVRSYKQLNYVVVKLSELEGQTKKIAIPLHQLDEAIGSGTQMLLQAAAK